MKGVEPIIFRLQIGRIAIVLHQRNTRISSLTVFTPLTPVASRHLLPDTGFLYAAAEKKGKLQNVSTAPHTYSAEIRGSMHAGSNLPTVLCIAFAA